MLMPAFISFPNIQKSLKSVTVKVFIFGNCYMKSSVNTQAGNKLSISTQAVNLEKLVKYG